MKTYSGVLCNRRMPAKLKGHVYKTVIRPALGSETWASTKKQDKRIEVSEMRMLRCMCGLIRNDLERTHPRNNESDADSDSD